MPPKPKGQQRTLESLWGGAASKKKTEKKKEDEDKKDYQPAKPSNSIRRNQGKPTTTKTSAAKTAPKKGKNANANLKIQMESVSKKRGSTNENKSVKKRKQILEDDSDNDEEMIDKNLPASIGTRASPRRKASMKSVNDDVMEVDGEVEKEATQKLDDEEFVNEEESEDEIMIEESHVEIVASDNQRTRSSVIDNNAELAKMVQKIRDNPKNPGTSFLSSNNPQKLPDKQYIEPVGIDATDGIVEGIVGGMVKKLGSLLVDAVKFDEKKREIGELTFPLKLQTACSGTDAPSLALGLVQEALDKFRTKDGEKMDHGFEYSHVMSCEIEPFKQAYIGRNFPGGLLFPDITKLTGGKTVTDVYGREQTIPEGNLFVAGTSCKDFSMLKTTHRKDIEDKGTSGETFLAAVEFLEQEQPPVAIFENVINAPWPKMQEYIEGRVNLRNRNEIDHISGLKEEDADADNQLKFSVENGGNYVAAEVPKQVGIRAGTIVEGFVKFGDNPKNVTPLRHKGKNTSNLLTLKEIAKLHGINLNKDTLVMEKKARYCTHLVKLDTKDYGLPQTRNRKYLFIWRSENPRDNLGEYFPRDHVIS